MFTSVLWACYDLLPKQGEFYSIAKPVEAPCVAPAIPPASTVDPESKMMYVWVSTYVPNTAAFVYQEAGILAYNLTANSSVVSKGIDPIIHAVFSFFINYLY